METGTNSNIYVTPFVCPEDSRRYQGMCEVLCTGSIHLMSLQYKSHFVGRQERHACADSMGRDMV